MRAECATSSCLVSLIGVVLVFSPFIKMRWWMVWKSEHAPSGFPLIRVVLIILLPAKMHCLVVGGLLF